MDEKIIRIEEMTDSAASGFLIITNKQSIELSIDNYQSCCEDWGYFLSEDNIDEFVGAIILNISLTDTCLRTEKLPEYGVEESGGVMFVNIETDRGLLQFTAYNSHNGYYGHDARIKSTQLTEEMCL